MDRVADASQPAWHRFIGYGKPDLFEIEIGIEIGIGIEIDGDARE